MNGLRAALSVWIAAAVIAHGAAGAAPATAENVPIPGGTAPLARALGLSAVPDRASFVVELTRVIYDAPEGKSATADSMVQQLVKHLDVVGRFQSALAEVQPPGGNVSLKMATQKNDRNRLKGFLDLVGLKLRAKNKAFTVEKTDNKQAAERLRLLADLGIDLTRLATRLNAGESVQVEVPTEIVPVPLSALVWSEAVFHRQIPRSELFSALVTDRQAALLSHGLAAVDDETLQFLIEHPAVITRLYEHTPGAFAAFGGSLHVHQGHIVVPGGEAAVGLWEAALDEKVSRPDRFIRELFGRDDGRFAYVYDALAHFDSARAAFALGLWIKESGSRVDRFNALMSAAVGIKEWDINARVFTRPANDPMMLLARVRAEPSGAPMRPAWRLFWSRAFDGTDLPDNPARQLRSFDHEGTIDAAWLADAQLSTDNTGRADRLDQFAFGQRVFGSADEGALPDALVAVRGFQRYRMLMLTLERMGVKTPAVYAGAARRASALSRLDANRGFTALGQFQGVVALLAGMARVRSLDAANIESLVASLSAVAPNEDGRYAGGVARWVQGTLGPTLPHVDDIDAAVAMALAGSRGGGTKETAAIVSWESRNYRLDLVAPELHRLTSVREKLGGVSLRLALDLERIAERLSAQNISTDDIKAGVADLKNLSGRLAQRAKKKEPSATILPPGVEAQKSPREIVTRAIEELSKIGKPKDVKKASHDASPLFAAVDTLLTDGLMSLAYALSLGDPDGTALLAGNVGRRHDFGFDKQGGGETKLRAAWESPQQIVSPGVPWHVSGSLLGLDLALAPLALRRIATDRILDPPVLTINQRTTFSETVVLLNPFELRDADRDAIADAIARGRARVEALAARGERLAELADEIRMDEWRRRAAQWTLENDAPRVASFFSLTELLYLGHPEKTAALDEWGVSGVAFDGCVCTKLQPPGGWILTIGRMRAGFLAAHVADLTLRIATTLRELRLPAALARGVLAAATQDYIDEVKPVHGNDWLALVRAAQAVSKERIEDYLAALTAVGGPLVPVTTALPDGPK